MPSNSKKLSTILCAIASGGAKSLVRVSSPNDRAGVQQALDLGADGVLIPYVNNAEEVRQAVSMCRYPPQGTRSVYFPQRSTNKAGLLGYVGNANKNIIIAIQIETADSIKNVNEIAAVDGVDILFLGQNDLSMSMGLYEKYEFPKMYTSPELEAATNSLIHAAEKHKKTLGLFLFGTERVAEFVKKGFTFISIGNDLHHVLTQAQSHMKALQTIFPVTMDQPNVDPSKIPSASTPPSSSNMKKSVEGDYPSRQQQQQQHQNSDENANIVLAGTAVAVIAVLALFVWRNRRT